jgi:hypothetical protein
MPPAPEIINPYQQGAPNYEKIRKITFVEGLNHRADTTHAALTLEDFETIEREAEKDLQDKANSAQKIIDRWKANHPSVPVTRLDWAVAKMMFTGQYPVEQIAHFCIDPYDRVEFYAKAIGLFSEAQLADARAKLANAQTKPPDGQTEEKEEFEGIFSSFEKKLSNTERGELNRHFRLLISRCAELDKATFKEMLPRELDAIRRVSVFKEEEDMPPDLFIDPSQAIRTRGVAPQIDPRILDAARPFFNWRREVIAISAKP